MLFTRRHIFRSGLAATALAALPPRAFAASTLTLGTVTIDTLSDGHLVLPTAMVSGHAGTAEVLADFGLTGPQVEPPCNLTLFRDGTNTVLFDVGAGPDFMPTAGKLAPALDALGVAPEEVTHIVFTHAHPDHLWGVLDEFDESVFANATHMMGLRERDYWLDPETQNTIDDGRKTFAAGALRRLQVLEERLVTFGEDEEILPGILSVNSYGHTPGHMAFEIRQGNSACMVVGDAIGNHHLAFARPLWESGSDQNAEAGAKVRLGLLDRLAQGQMPLIGYHLPEGGMGRVERAGEAYRFVPEV